MEFECTINRKSAKEIYKKTGKNVCITIIKSEYLQKVAFLEDEIAVSGDLNNIVCKIAYKRIKKYYSSQHYYIFKTRGGLLFCVEKSKISPADREKLAELFRTKMPQLKIPWELQQSIYGR